MKYLFDGSGEAVAVLESNFVFDMDGYPVGFLQGDLVYKMSGDFVGHLYQDMVVDTFQSSPGSTMPPGAPGRMPPPDRIPGRGTMDYGYPDRIHNLFEK